ncbi:hypothetical protein [Arthrobacter sp.]|uniref:DsrE family protein n=1 Tax=Arthrobacter sp. TaxID=1667 RepID=UPI003A91B2AA
MDNPAEQQVLLHATQGPEDIARAVAALAPLGESLPGARISVIVNGKALAGVRKDAEPIDASRRAQVFACELGMSRNGITAEGLQEGLGTVPSAVVALATGQLDGAAYIRI